MLSAFLSLSCPFSLKPTPVHRGSAPWALPAINPPQLKSGDMFSFPSFRCLITEQIATFISPFFCCIIPQFLTVTHNLLIHCVQCCWWCSVLFAFTDTWVHGNLLGDEWWGYFARANWHISVAHTAMPWHWIITVHKGVQAEGYMGHLTEWTWPRGAGTIWNNTLKTISACLMNIN